MNYKVKTIPKFEKELKRLSKNYPSLKNEYLVLLHSLKQQPKQDTSLGNECYKLPLSIATKGKGKSGGARVITYLQIWQTTVYRLTIFDKSEHENIPDKELEDILKWIPK